MLFISDTLKKMLSRRFSKTIQPTSLILYRLVQRASSTSAVSRREKDIRRMEQAADLFLRDDMIDDFDKLSQRSKDFVPVYCSMVLEKDLFNVFYF